MHCAKCGTKIQEDTVFCPKCGNKIKTNIPQFPWYARLITFVLLGSLGAIMCVAMAIVGIMYFDVLQVSENIQTSTPQITATSFARFERITPMPTEPPIISVDNDGQICFHNPDSDGNIQVDVNMACLSSSCTAIQNKYGSLQLDGQKQRIIIHARLIARNDSIDETGAHRPCTEDCMAGVVTFWLEDPEQGRYEIVYGNKSIGVLTIPISTSGSECFSK